MLVSISRRTDIPAHHAAWFFTQLHEGFALSRNPYRPQQVRRVSLLPDEATGFVFWTKNPGAMLDHAGFGWLDVYAYYVQYTFNAYGHDIEPFLAPAQERLASFKRLAEKAGPHRVIWRYDPILLNESYTAAWHQDQFGKLAGLLQGYTEQVIISFVDWYAKIRRKLEALGVYQPTDEAQCSLARELAALAQSAGLSISMCAEADSLRPYGIPAASCIDGALIARIRQELGCAEIPAPASKDKGQRPHCGCAPSVDIGTYRTCPHGCVYCYAA